MKDLHDFYFNILFILHIHCIILHHYFVKIVLKVFIFIDMTLIEVKN